MKIKNKVSAVLAAAAIMLTGCGANPQAGGSDVTEAVNAAADVSADNSTGTVKPVILTVSFGTSYNDSREITIGAVEKAIAEANPDYEVRRAFTAQTIIDILKERDNIQTDNIEEALDRLVSDGVKEIVVQPTHIMNGYEYDDTVAAVEEYRDKFDKVSFGLPLLSSDKDYTDVAGILTSITSEYNAEDTAIVFMGHGTEHEANAVYTKLQDTLSGMGADNYFIGTVEATPSLDDVLGAVKAGGYKKVVLQPLMVVSGDHANNDMAGDEEDSWKSVFEKEGFEVECVLRGLGEFPEIRNIYADHVKSAVNG